MDKEMRNSLDALFEKEMKENRLKGCSIHVMQGGDDIFHKCYGADKENSIYRICSMTKPITAIAAMIVYERGLIDLLAPISDYLPSFSHMKVVKGEEIVEASHVITVQHLLNMTSGIVYPGDASLAEYLMRERLGKLWTKEEEKIADMQYVCEEISKSPLLFEPGTSYKYGLSADVMAAIIERVTGVKYGEFLQKEIFDKLGMTDTGFEIKKSELNRLQPSYIRKEDGTIEETPETIYKQLGLSLSYEKNYYQSGGAGLYSTLNDYKKFVTMLLNKGSYDNKRMIGRKTFEFLITPQLSEEIRKTMDFECVIGYNYANYMRILTDMRVGSGSIGEFGWDGMAGTYFLVDTAENLAVIYMQQIASGVDMGLRRKMKQIIYGAL